MKVLVAGANGKTARHLVRMLVADGHEVRGLVRKEGQLAEVGANGAEPVLVDLEGDAVGEAFKGAFGGAVGAAVGGCDAVIFAAGAGPGSGDARKETMDFGGAAKLVEAAEGRGVRRFVMLGTMGADDPEGGPEAMRPYLRAKARADERLRRSGLDWTIVRPGGLTDGAGTGRIEAAKSLGRRGRIPREDTARTLADVLDIANTSRKTFEVLAGGTPIREALESL